MYKTNDGTEIYESMDDLIKKGITHIWDYHDVYYVRVKTDDYYDNGIWVVNKKDKTVSHGYYTDFIVDIMDKAKPIDPETLRRVS